MSCYSTQYAGDAVSGHTTTFAWSRTISQIKLASLTMATGDPHEATVIGSAVLDVAGTIRSRRATDDLRELAQRITTMVLTAVRTGPGCVVTWKT